jgi:beclin 1
VFARLQACKMTFSQYRLLPMGSHPRIADSKGTHDLFGPVNRFLCINYDRAVVCFLACLKVSLPQYCRGDLLSFEPAMF